MLKLILVRHGETEWNFIRRIQGGNSDTPLNETGKRQAKGIGLRLKSEPIAAIYSSPLQRARDTAQAIADHHHPLQVEFRPSLREIMVGELEGMLATEMKQRFDELICLSCGDKSSTRLPGGESISDVQRRAWETFQEITGKHSQGTVVLVTHYFVILTLVCSVLNLPLNEITRLRTYPGTITVITVENGSSRLELFNDGCHTPSPPYNRLDMTNKRPAPTLEKRVLQFIRRHGLVEKGQKVLAAVSGGPDSVCLLGLLRGLQKELDITLHIAHLNHGLRGAEAEAEADLVAELARQWDIPATLALRDVAAYRLQYRLSLEEAAREVRYLFLAETARLVGASRLAVGHTANDHIETLLLHLIRGTGTRGLLGLRPCLHRPLGGAPLTVIRPLLEIEHAETVDYCRRNRLLTCSDPSNQSLSLLRNRVRHELLPLLESYNPAIQTVLRRTARLAGDEMAFLTAAAAGFQKTFMQRQAEVITLSKTELLKLPPALQRHLLRQALEELLGDLKDIETRHIEELSEFLAKPAGRKLDLPYGLCFRSDYDRFVLGWDLETAIPLPELEGCHPLNIPGLTLIPGWQVQADILPPDQKPALVADNFTAAFDLAKISTEIVLRPRRPGDWFQPLGLDQPKKVGAFMLDARIPRDWRRRVPILATPQQIIWVAGWRIDERVKVTPETRAILMLRLVRRQDEQSGDRGQPG